MLYICKGRSIAYFKSQMQGSRPCSQLTLPHLAQALAQDGLLMAVWQATAKIITTACTHHQALPLGNCFTAHPARSETSTQHSHRRQSTHLQIRMQPTQALLNECDLTSKAPPSTLKEPVQAPFITQNTIFKYLSQQEKEYFRNDKQLLMRLLYLLLGKIKEVMLKEHNLILELHGIGVMTLISGSYSWQGVPVLERTSSTPHLQTLPRPLLPIGGGRHSPPTPSYQAPSQDSVIEGPSSPSNANSSNRGHTTIRTRVTKKHSPLATLQQRKLHESITLNQPANTRIPSSLLGAGTDPLTLHNTHSTLLTHPKQLLQEPIPPPIHNQTRLPGIIDQFTRTKGSQASGVKVSNSIVVRIGSNYTPSARYCNLQGGNKGIVVVAEERKIALAVGEKAKNIGLQPASEQQEYKWVTNTQKNNNLEQKVKIRQQTYDRYTQYYSKIVPNTAVAPLSQQTLEHIVKPIKSIAKGLGKEQGAPFINKLINEVNQEYYKAYKKAVLDYVLKDQEERRRVGIGVIFNKAREWGELGVPRPIKHKVQFNMEINELKKTLSNNLHPYPQILSFLHQQNTITQGLPLFRRRKPTDFRPYNILYYIKRNTNQLTQTENHLRKQWVAVIAQHIQQKINIKQEPYSKLKIFFGMVHVLMSNALKAAVYGTLRDMIGQFSQFEDENDASHETGKNRYLAPPLLTINISEQQEKVCFMDDIQKVFRQELLQLLTKMVETSQRIPRVQNNLQLTTDLHIWGVNPEDSLVEQVRIRLQKIISQNYSQVISLKDKLSKLQCVYKFREEAIGWIRHTNSDHSNLGDADQLRQKLKTVKELENEVCSIRSYYRVNMVVVDCMQLKKKLLGQLKTIRKVLFETMEERLRVENQTILTKINSSMEAISKNAANTSQYVEICTKMERIRESQLGVLQASISKNTSTLLKLLQNQGFPGSLELLKSSYQCRQGMDKLRASIEKHQARLAEERVEIERRLRDKITQFQNQTMAWVKDVTNKVENFDMRKLHQEYMGILKDYQQKVEANREIILALNHEQDDLKWAATTFTHAIDLEGLVEPNYELWKVVGEFDLAMKDWKYLELSRFDVEGGEAKIKDIEARIGKVIPKLKHFGALKIIYELQSEVKEFFAQQVPIIKIFSNPGLKDRHWSLFNKRLPLPGFDLKQLTYGRIKVLYDFQKNLKVLMSISNQAGKEHDIQKSKQEMQQHWWAVTLQLYHMPEDHLIALDQASLDHHIATMDQHITKTLLLKNSPFSKALAQMLGEWQQWLASAMKVMSSLSNAQKKFKVLRSIFRVQEVAKLLPIEATEYDSIENIWKSIMKKVMEQPRLSEFLRSQKMGEIIEQIAKKSDYIRGSFKTYLNLKRAQFNRLYFLPEQTVLRLLGQQQQDILVFMARHCFNGVTGIVRGDGGFTLKSSCDQLNLSCDLQPPKKGQSKIFEELTVIQRHMKENMRKEIKQLSFFKESFEKNTDEFTLSSLFTVLQLQFTAKTAQKTPEQVEIYFSTMKKHFVSKLREDFSLKTELLITKCLFLQWRCREQSQHTDLRVGIKEGETIISIMDCSIASQYEYTGDETPCFLSMSTDQLWWHVAISVTHQIALHVPAGHSHLLKTMALFAGQNYVTLDDPLLVQPNNLDSLITGVISTSFWLHLQDRFLKMNANALTMLSQAYQHKHEHTQGNANTMTYKMSQLTLSSSTVLFLSMPQERFRALPDGVLTCMRTLTLTTPCLTKIHLYLRSLNRLEHLKNYLWTLSYSHKIIPGRVWAQASPLETWDGIFESVKQKLWPILSPDQRSNLVRTFEEQELQKSKEQEQAQEVCQESPSLMSKKQDILDTLSWSQVVFLHGEGIKTELVDTILAQYGIKDRYSLVHGINLSFIQQSSSPISALTYLKKAVFHQSQTQDKPILLYIDTDLTDWHFQAIQQLLSQHPHSPQYTSPLRVLANSRSLAHLPPAHIASYASVHVCGSDYEDKSVYRQWVLTAALPQQARSKLRQLQNVFYQMLGWVARSQKRVFEQSPNTLAQRLMSLLLIWLQPLNSAHIDQLPQFDRQSFIFCSMIFCGYWSLGVGCLDRLGREWFKKQLREAHGERLEMPGDFDQCLLNQQNQWVYWQTLREQFSGQKEGGQPYYHLYVPTGANTAYLTIIIKLITHNHSLLLCGNESAGKSALLKQIPNFELPHHPFLLDCHPHSSVYHTASTIQQRIIFGEWKQNLVLIDDVHLPQVDLAAVLHTTITEKYSPNLKIDGPLNIPLTIPTLVATWNSIHQPKQRCQASLLPHLTPMHTQLTEEDLQTIYRTYLKGKLTTNQLDPQMVKLQNTLVNYIKHTYKVFPAATATQLSELVRSLCRVGLERGNQSVMQHLLVESREVLAPALPTHESHHLFRHLSHYYAKLLEIQLKNNTELTNQVSHYRYYLPPHTQHPDLSPPNHSPQLLSEWLRHQVASKDSTLTVTDHHVAAIIKIVWIIRAHKSHLLLLSQCQVGVKTLTKMAAWIAGLHDLDLQEISLEGFLSEVMKVLKTGGKIDECLAILPYSALTSRPELEKLIHSLMFSPEFHECFGHILMEEIIKAFNAQKKFLKRNVKKIELVTKIREKFDGIFHFCFIVPPSALDPLLQTSPNFKHLRRISLDPWPAEAMHKIVNTRIENTAVVSCLMKGQEQILNKWSEVAQHPSTHILHLMNMFEVNLKMMKHRAKTQQQNTQIWSKRIKLNEQKTDNLLKQKKIFEVQNSEYFNDLQTITNTISQKTKELQQLEAQYQVLQAKTNELDQQCTQAKDNHNHHEKQVLEQYHMSVTSNKGQIKEEVKSLSGQAQFNEVCSRYLIDSNKAWDQLQQLFKTAEEDRFQQIKDIDCSKFGILGDVFQRYKQQMAQLMESQVQLDTIQAEHQTALMKSMPAADGIKRLSKEIKMMHKEEASMREKSANITKGYNQITERIAQNESIGSILTKFEHLLKSKNNMGVTLPENLQGCAALLTLQMAYLPYLPEDRWHDTTESIVKRILEADLQVSPDMLRGLFPHEEEFKLTHLHRISNHQLVTFFGLLGSNLNFVGIGTPQCTHQWIEEIMEREVIWLRQEDDLRQMCSKGQVLLVDQPNGGFLSKLTPFVQGVGRGSATRAVIVDQEEFNYHQKCKIIFMYDSITEVPSQLTVHCLPTLLFKASNASLASSVLENRLLIEGQVPGRDQIIQEYIKGCHEISSMDEKMHSVIIKMKKQNVISDIIYKKIEEEGENKLGIEKKLSELKASLQEIQRELDFHQVSLQKVVTIYQQSLGNNYDKKNIMSTKQRILSLEAFMLIFNSVLNTSTSKDMSAIIFKLKVYLSLLLKGQLQHSADSALFDTLTLNLTTQQYFPSIILTSNQLTLTHQYLLHLWLRHSHSIIRVNLDDPLTNQLKEGEHHYGLVSREQQWSPVLEYIRSHRQRWNKMKFMWIVLQRLKTPAEIATRGVTLPFKHINKLLTESSQKEHEKSHSPIEQYERYFIRKMVRMNPSWRQHLQASPSP